MEFQYNILMRVREIERKNGINYAKIDGALFSGIKVLYILICFYTLIINFLSAAGLSITNHTEHNADSIKSLIITIIVASILLIAGLVIIKFREKIWANITFVSINLLSSIYLLLTFGKELKDGIGFLGYNLSFYWRHAIPLTLIAILSIWLFIIALRDILKTQKEYKKVVETIYQQYLATAPEGQTSEELWQEYLKNYKF